MTGTYRSARLHGIKDLRVDHVRLPVLEPQHVLVRVEACGICPTDVRKFLVGVNDGQYPFNPGHEWVGRVVDRGRRATGVEIGERVYGDTYGGYAEYAVIDVNGGGWSHGPLQIPEDVPLHRAVFVEPLADCLHALLDQGKVVASSRVLVVGSGQMGLQMVAVAAHVGAVVTAADPVQERRALALELGASHAVDPSEGELVELLGSSTFDVVVLTLGRPDLAGTLLPLLDVGGRLVLFAGFGPDGRTMIDLNSVHYRELTIVGSEWVGTPPQQHLERYKQARDLLVSGGNFAFERLVSGICGLEGLLDAFDEVGHLRSLKHILELEGER